MNDHAQTITQQTDAVRRLRARRSTDALVARYLLELSGRYGHTPLAAESRA